MALLTEKYVAAWRTPLLERALSDLAFSKRLGAKQVGQMEVFASELRTALARLALAEKVVDASRYLHDLADNPRFREGPGHATGLCRIANAIDAYDASSSPSSSVPAACESLGGVEPSGTEASAALAR